MKKKALIWMLGVWIGLGSCSSYLTSSRKVMEVQKGMSRQEVIDILGKPDYRRFDGDIEELEFRRILSATPSVILVRFVDGKVTVMDTFAEPASATPGTSVSLVAPPPPGPESCYGEHPKRITLLTDKELEALLEKLKFSFGDEAKEAVSRMLDEHDVTSAQCVAISKECVIDRADVIVMLYPYVRDQQNFQKVVDTLNTRMEREEVQKRLDKLSTKKD